MGNKFTLVLNREITDDESGALKEAGCADAAIESVSLPGNADTVVTQLDFDTDAGPSLAEAIESALEAVKTVPDLTVPTLTVPAQPAAAPAENGTSPVAEPAAIEAAAEPMPEASAEVSDEPAPKPRRRSRKPVETGSSSD